LPNSSNDQTDNTDQGERPSLNQFYRRESFLVV